MIGHVLRQEEDMYQLDNIADFRLQYYLGIGIHRQHRLE
jgi:hypothetical protein